MPSEPFSCSSEQKNSLVVDVEPEDTVTVLSKIYMHPCENRKSDLGPLGVSLNPKAVFRLSTGRQASTLTWVLVTRHSLARLPAADAVRRRKHPQTPVGTLSWCGLLARDVADHELKGILGGGVLKFLRVSQSSCLLGGLGRRCQRNCRSWQPLEKWFSHSTLPLSVLSVIVGLRTKACWATP